MQSILPGKMERQNKIRRPGGRGYVVGVVGGACLGWFALWLDFLGAVYKVGWVIMNVKGPKSWLLTS